MQLPALKNLQRCHSLSGSSSTRSSFIVCIKAQTSCHWNQCSGASTRRCAFSLISCCQVGKRISQTSKTAVSSNPAWSDCNGPVAIIITSAFKSRCLKFILVLFLLILFFTCLFCIDIGYFSADSICSDRPNATPAPPKLRPYGAIDIIIIIITTITGLFD